MLSRRSIFWEKESKCKSLEVRVCLEWPGNGAKASVTRAEQTTERSEFHCTDMKDEGN